MVLYFAYGSNLSLEQMKRRCPGSRMLDAGYIEDHELSFTTYADRWKGGVADILEKKGSRVWGLVYELSVEDLSSLDYYEGFPDLYRRKKLKVFGRKDEYDEVLTYFVVDKKGYIPPSRVYFEIIYDAARVFGFSGDYLHLLEGFLNDQ
jgi:gamma-glutamylcyclotransferase (GGCT)/AIG2-like uncharacterized protein YtfP